MVTLEPIQVPFPISTSFSIVIKWIKKDNFLQFLNLDLCLSCSAGEIISYFFSTRTQTFLKMILLFYNFIILTYIDPSSNICRKCSY